MEGYKVSLTMRVTWKEALEARLQVDISPFVSASKACALKNEEYIIPTVTVMSDYIQLLG